MQLNFLHIPSLIFLLVASMGQSTVLGSDANRPPLYARTNDLCHVAVFGGGYLMTRDDEGKRVYFRSCSLEQNRNGELCTRFAGDTYVLEPRLTLPEGAFELLVGSNGLVVAMHRGPDFRRQDVGQLSVATFRSTQDLREVGPGVFVGNGDEIPTTVRLGEESGVFLFQGWINWRYLKSLGPDIESSSLPESDAAK